MQRQQQDSNEVEQEQLINEETKEPQLDTKNLGENQTAKVSKTSDKVEKRTEAQNGKISLKEKNLALKKENETLKKKLQELEKQLLEKV